MEYIGCLQETADATEVSFASIPSHLNHYLLCLFILFQNGTKSIGNQIEFTEIHDCDNPIHLEVRIHCVKKFDVHRTTDINFTVLMVCVVAIYGNIMVAILNLNES